MSEEEIFDGVIQNYIAEHTTTEKYYTQKYVDEIKEERDKYKSVLDKIKEYIENLLKEEFEVTDPDSSMFGEKCQRAYFSDSELGKILELLEEIE